MLYKNINKWIIINWDNRMLMSKKRMGGKKLRDGGIKVI